MRFTLQERKAIFAGTLMVLRRPSKPEQESGAKVVVSHTEVVAR